MFQRRKIPRGITVYSSYRVCNKYVAAVDYFANASDNGDNSIN